MWTPQQPKAICAPTTSESRTRRLSLKEIFDDALQLVAERNSDFYECVEGKLVKLGSKKKKGPT